MEGDFSDNVYTNRDAISAVWVMISTGMIFFMQAGFALIESGSVRKKNSSSILVKNLYNVIVGIIGFWLIGYGLAFGDVRIFIG